MDDRPPGGATDIEPEEDAYRAGCLRALEAGRAILETGGSAVDAVAAAIQMLEEDPTFNAGTGSATREDGGVEMDAAVMDGRTFALRAVAVITDVRHSIGLARALLEEGTCILAGPSAQGFARQRGLGRQSVPPLRTVPEERRVHGHDAVGCVALDASGRLAAGPSADGIDGALPWSSWRTAARSTDDSGRPDSTRATSWRPASFGPPSA